ncbi:hypothetical protein P43SY_010592 [Pythium insidiosum]|uniref:Protein kinase domain-containing protein n=1 Tax=Pythium insidiosum TaxID=114742 RepID=A0AAD5L8F3_PYTIN|nr:hypothetical protein P43SY_010592 [Pythium insidiosum]
MGQALSIPQIRHTKDAVLLALYHALPAQDDGHETVSLQTQLLQHFKRRDKGGRGWLHIEELLRLLEDLGLSEHWARDEVCAFAECFSSPSPGDDNNVCDDQGTQLSGRFDYALFIDFVFFPVVSPARSKALTLSVTRVDIARSTAWRVHSGRLGESAELTIKELAHARRSDDAGSQSSDAHCVTASDIAEFRQHVNALRLLVHPNLSKYVATLESSGRLYVVESAHTSCSLHTILNSFGPMKETTVRRYLLQILQALEFLHSHSVAHGHLHLESVNVDSYGLADVWCFGVLALQMTMGIGNQATSIDQDTPTAASIASTKRSASSPSLTKASTPAKWMPPIPNTLSKNLHTLALLSKRTCSMISNSIPVEIEVLKN